ncbi:Rossmann-fold NAD(P)-binding domain-containing protein [Sandaracinobacteroides saxicola]|uniref:SDR family NAD(P)-dependent oxidoreductase n=1 Tax=Sandaracinobacteroides saxicola TaxID=2759707 RepID=A0A7G5IEK2_9SPHN|nr:SDR family NAD(P)-dependent oxidoreductase [Sandaracinobacteroides saxicola]QMW21794.1 SDR family NAD(P)-dependent oxidoreductase [Sandaracinobacteroides saxicola]
MMRLCIVGMGYSGAWIGRAAEAAGLEVVGVRRAASADVIGFDEAAVAGLVAEADFLLSSVPPWAEGDPVLARFGAALRARRGWTGYLSSTGVYGDCGGAWVDESAAVGTGRRTARSAADADWQALGATVFRLPGIYGPGRSAIEAVREGTARRVNRPGHVFSRVHVADIAGAVVASMKRDFRGVVNVADDLPAEPRAVTEFACGLLGSPLPPLLPLDEAGLSPMALGFWTERRRVANGRLTGMLGYRLRFPDYKSGLVACLRSAS